MNRRFLNKMLGLQEAIFRNNLTYRVRCNPIGTFANTSDSSVTQVKEYFLPLRDSLAHSIMIEEQIHKCIELTELNHGWDGHNAIPVTIEKASFAMAIISQLVEPQIHRPSIIPGYNRTIQIEWCEKNYELEIEITKSNEVKVFLTDLETDEMQEVCLNISKDEKFYEVLSNLGELTNNKPLTKKIVEKVS